MGWAILIFVLLAAKRGSAAAASPQRPTSILPVQRGVIPFSDGELHVPRVVNPNLAIDGLTQITPNVYAPDQYRDTLARKINRVASLGPSIDQQAASLLAFGNGADRGGQSISFDTGRAVEGFV